ncbi:S9 family peptidase [Maribacter algarum]|uniref:S9 family peptidase n=1 Tax=Maribacter algarum (ex Zhang et al. 2020) TaxID=2578118 RepID=A0A5S3PRH3_9FLAO|nr:S9 family peptidase [Maribacter algarum]TMM57284.1 S9 family peptidase [Maribacter algarum]
MKKLFLVVGVLFGQLIFPQSEMKVPSFEEVLSLPVPSNPQISPKGEHILFQLRTTDWEANKYDTEIWLSKNGEKAFPLTHNPESSSHSPKWSPDGKWIAFISNRGNGNQIQVIRLGGGESFPATNIDGGINSFEWSPNGQQFTISMNQKDSKEDIALNERFGDYEIDDKTPKHSWLYTIDFKPEHINAIQHPCNQENDCIQWPKPIALLDSVDFSIGAFKWSPDGSKIVFDKQPNNLTNSYLQSDIGILDAKTKNWNVLVKNSSFDFLIDWSPDGKSIVYVTALDNNNSTNYKNNHFYTIDLDSKNKQELAKDFDEELKDLVWTKNGIYAMAYQKTKIELFLIDPSDGTIKLLKGSPNTIHSFSIARDGSTIAFLGNTKDNLKEIYTSALSQYAPRKITDFTARISNWKVAQSEVIRWKSSDGTMIEGILHKPKDYDATKKYPLLVNVHGGPTAADRPTPIPVFYPVLQWLDKGALVLRPNYRGSGGYGEKFRSLNVENMGLGAVDDILSGIDYLDSLGIINTEKMGSMGWSHGGYISALLATTTNRFKAISVGAGISNWATYYVATDLHPFTRQYLKATPWNNPEIYAKTSPITYINQATTPTLIQHGEYDQRVPIENAYELLQGLRDRDVDTELIVYNGVGHTIYKPKVRLAGVWHNWQWFGKYIFGEDIQIPVE